MQFNGENGLSGVVSVADRAAWASVPWTAVFAPSTGASGGAGVDSSNQIVNGKVGGSINGKPNGKVDDKANDSVNGIANGSANGIGNRSSHGNANGVASGCANGIVNGCTNGNVNRADVQIIGWLKSGVPYLPLGKAASLQTFDIWVPNPQPTATDVTAPDPSSLPISHHGQGTWIVYIHGGAWRDPRISSTSFAPAATDLLLRAARARAVGGTSKLAGVVSLNYRLSPHPSFPSSSPSGPEPPSHQAQHPDHIADVLAGLAFLRRLLQHHYQLVDDHGSKEKGNILRAPTGRHVDARPQKPEQRWILAGHSCGATLAFQSVMDPARWGLAGHSAGGRSGTTITTRQDDNGYNHHPAPAAIVGFNGLYDLAGFIASPPPAYAHLREAYREFVTGAFGPDRLLRGSGKGGGGGQKTTVWTAVCPATAEGSWVNEWLGDNEDDSDGSGYTWWWRRWWWRGNAEKEQEKKKRKGVVVLVQSREDTLVPWQQLEAMRDRLARERRRVDVRVLEGRGDHDDVWRDGDKMAEVLWELSEEL
ncbi:hypothetical protein VTH82DRAFT_8344 [Thermothelomyces myriococcoides]